MPQRLVAISARLVMGIASRVFLNPLRAMHITITKKGLTMAWPLIREYTIVGIYDGVVTPYEVTILTTASAKEALKKFKALVQIGTYTTYTLTSKVIAEEASRD